MYEAVGRVRIGIWVEDKGFNGLLTLVDDQRAQIEVSGATRIRVKEVKHAIGT